jgi:putative ABC transport system permease protein
VIYLRLGIKNLTRKKIRTILTILGITLSISFTVGLLSVSEGFLFIFNNTLSRRGVDMFIFSKKAGNLPLFIGRVSKEMVIPENFVEKIRKIKNIELVVPVSVMYAELEIFTPGVPFIVDGIQPELLPELRPHSEILSGRLLNKNDKYSLLLGYTAAQARNLKVGDKYNILDIPFKVVGIYKQEGTLVDMKVNAPIKIIQEIKGEKGKIDYIMVRVKDIEKIKETEKEIREKFPSLSTYTLQEIINQAKEMLLIARAVHLSISSFALLVGILFIACTMIMSISERVREFSTLRVIGASKKFIFYLVLSEAIILSLISGILGCIGGYFLSKFIVYFVKHLVKVSYLNTHISLKIFLYGILISFICGIISGLFPAWEISKRNISEGLRYE